MPFIEVLKDNLDFRLDAEYFKKKYLEYLSLLSDIGYQTVGSFSYVTDGIHTSIDYSEDSGINLISAQSPKDNEFDISRKAYISSTSHEANPRTALKIGDVILSTVGTIGNCAVVDESILPANSDRHVGIIRLKAGISPYFLSTFLLSKYGKFQTLRESTGNVQLNLFLYKIRELKVSALSTAFQFTIESFVKQAHQAQELSKALYQESEILLLTELGIKDWQPTTETVEVKSFADSFSISERLDSEFYQPKFDELEDKLRLTNQQTTLGSLLTFCQRGTQPIYVEEEGTIVLNSKHIRENRIDFTNNRMADLEDTRSALVIRKGDVLVNGTGVGTIGRAAAYLLDDEAIPDNHVTILRSKLIDPVFLALQLNSIVGKLQVEKYFKGSSGQIELYPDDIKQFRIWQAPDEVQKKIRAAIEMAQEQSGKGRQVLDIAKHAVELAIETSEDEAVAWLNEQT